MKSLAQVIEDFDPSSEINPPPNCFQGRTLYGGVSAALALQAALRNAPAGLPSPRSAQISFIGPVSESLRFRTQLLRQGKSATSLSVDCISGPDVALRATFLFANPRPSKIRHDFSKAPPVSAPETYARLAHNSSLPAFFANFDIRFAGKSLPVSGGGHPELIAWVRHLDASGVDPAVALLALTDCLPPAAMVCFPDFAPISTMTWTIDLQQPATSDEWFLLRSTALRTRDGYSFQTMEAWDAKGTAVLAGCQTVAIFT